MKNDHKHRGGRNMALIAVSLIFMCQNINAQPVFRPLFRRVPYQQGYDQNQRTQNVRQDYYQWDRRGGPRPVISIGIHFDPLVSWFTTGSYDIRNEGAVPGYSFGVTYNSYFADNYSFSSGISIISSGGSLTSRETTLFEIRNYSREIVTVGPGEAIIYKINYLSVPLGLKLQTNQTAYGVFFADLGFDPKIVVLGRADIPALNIKGNNAMPELRRFNLSYHIMAGIEYPLGGNNNLTAGIGFDNNFLDITRDNGDQPWDMISHKLLSLRIGITF